MKWYERLRITYKVLFDDVHRMKLAQRNTKISRISFVVSRLLADRSVTVVLFSSDYANVEIARFTKRPMN